MALAPLPRTVILDYYDSYTNNLLTLFTKLYTDVEVLRKVVVVKADRFSWDEFQQEVLPTVDCVILSPGPGRPDNPSDIGFALDLLRLHPVPILGVCLGHQAIGVAFGAKIINTPQITHGHVVPVAPVQPEKGLFASPAWKVGSEEGEEFEVVVYNSLTVEPGSLPDELEVTAWSVPAPGKQRTVQGLAHKEYPIWGVQYHPESISSTRGTALLQSFLLSVHCHHSATSSYPALPSALLSACAYRISAAGSSKPSTPRAPGGGPWPTPPISPSGSQASDIEGEVPLPRGFRLAERRFGDVGKDVETRTVFDAMIRSVKGKANAVGEIWLDGQTPTRPTTASLASPSLVMTYSLATRTVTLHRAGVDPVQLDLGEDTFWDWFSSGHASISASLPPQTTRGGWRGGWVGWFGYEMKEESLAGYRRGCKSPADGSVKEVDACWAWVDTMVQRTPDGKWVARGIVGEPLPTTSWERGEEDMLCWLASQGVRFGTSVQEFERTCSDLSSILSSPSSSAATSTASFPAFHPIATGSDYRSRIDSCREAIRQGESYELTLTTRFLATLNSTEPYDLYLRLRTFNPAYYSAYMSFPSLTTPRGNGIHVLSSSPERFLKIEGGQVEMMPIKGTRARVKPGHCVCTPETGCRGVDEGGEACVEEANREDEKRGRELQSDPKERAENLMIVDLIRSDLLSCCTPSTVTVPKLIALESYGVHNLVTTVRGKLASNVGSVEAVRRCFPPGSMTGAPKLRSVQLLDRFEEGRRRGIYSGALGYIGLDGETDLSVVIRTIIIEGHKLSIGAGGAITWLSDRDGEWEEVLTKVRSVVGMLAGVH